MKKYIHAFMLLVAAISAAAVLADIYEAAKGLPLHVTYYAMAMKDAAIAIFCLLASKRYRPRFCPECGASMNEEEEK
jgi:hypothetical protein